MKIALGFTSIHYDETIQKLAEGTMDCVPKIIVDWDYPVLPAIGEVVDIQLLASFPQVPRELIKPMEFVVEYVYWSLHNQQPIPIVQLRGK